MPRATRRPRPPARSERLFTSSGPRGRFTIPRAELVARLCQHGYLAYTDCARAKRRATDQELRTALIAFQRFHGLDVDGWAGPVTQKALQTPRFCGLPDMMALQEKLLRWPLDRERPILRWHVT